MSAPLAGRHVIVTAGPTLEAIDPVRFISNRSSGTQGYAIAEALAALGARVSLVSGPTSLDDPAGVETQRIESAREMLAAVEARLPADAFIAVAAVADWRPAQTADRKIKGDKSVMANLELVENPDILATISRHAEARPGLVIGFAAETHDVEAHAIAKRDRKNCDWIVANDVSGDVMGGPDNAVLLITADGTEKWPRARKSDIAAQLAARIAQSFTN